MDLWVDVIWIKSEPLGLGAQRYLQIMREVFANEPSRT